MALQVVGQEPWWQRSSQRCTPHASTLSQVAPHVGVGSVHDRPETLPCETDHKIMSVLCRSQARHTGTSRTDAQATRRWSGSCSSSSTASTSGQQASLIWAHLVTGLLPASRHAALGEWHLTLPQGQWRGPCMGQGPQAPAWQASSHACCPQANALPHMRPHCKAPTLHGTVLVSAPH